MAQVRLMIGGRGYELVCREGEEAHYEALAARIDTMAQAVSRAVGSVGETRLLLLSALLLADELDAREAGSTPSPSPAVDPQLVVLLESVADRLESFGRKLEKATDQA